MIKFRDFLASRCLHASRIQTGSATSVLYYDFRVYVRTLVHNVRLSNVDIISAFNNDIGNNNTIIVIIVTRVYVYEFTGKEFNANPSLERCERMMVQMQQTDLIVFLPQYEKYLKPRTGVIE